MQLFLQCFKSCPTKEEEELLRSNPDQPDYDMPRIYVKKADTRETHLVYWHYKKRDNNIVNTADRIAMSAKDYQLDQKYLSQRSFVIPYHLFIYISQVSTFFWLPFIDWPKLYPDQTPIFTDKGWLREDFAAAADLAFLEHQLERANELVEDCERRPLEDLEVMREGIGYSEKRREQYNIALDTYNCKSSFHRSVGSSCS